MAAVITKFWQDVIRERKKMEIVEKPKLSKVFSFD